MRLPTRVLAILCILCAASVGFASGSQEPGFEGESRVVGSGRSATENRTVTAFTGIDLQGHGKVLLTIGSPRSLSVSADDNLLRIIRTDVVGGTLRMGFQPGTIARTLAPLVFRITVPRIEELSISGSGDIVGQSVIRADRLVVSIGGSGDIRAEIAVEEIAASIHGSGNIDLSGRADSQGVRINGSGDYRARELESTDARVEIHGSGHVMIFVSRDLAVSTFGSGDVRYHGDPRVTVTSSGSGTVRRE